MEANHIIIDNSNMECQPVEKKLPVATTSPTSSDLSTAEFPPSPDAASSVSSQQQVLQARRQQYGPNAALNYSQPLHMVRGEGTYLWDAKGRQYLDCVNNVAHLGHCHPGVTAAVCQQLGTLNTNSRYLSEALTGYTEQLLATFPEQLEVAYLVNSGSEANDLALRICRPDATHAAVMAGAYHGHTMALIPLSPYKFWGPGGAGQEAHVHVMPCPDTYRQQDLDGRASVRAVIAAAQQQGARIGAFFCESVVSCGGQVVLPPGYLAAVYEEMRAAGAMCVADEVQCGFGRAGSAFWAFETQAVVPDIVTLGKPIGNGFPLGAVVLTRAAAQGFSASGMEYFNTYGGCTAAAVAGAAVLRALKQEQLQERAAEVGLYLLHQLRALQPRFPFLGDVRGLGLMVGIECVRDGSSKQHAPMLAKWIKERMAQRQVLLSCDGPYDNVIKVKPPMVFGRPEVDQLVAALVALLQEELTAQQWQVLMAAEEAHWQQVVAPRMALYQRNRALLLGGGSS